MVVATDQYLGLSLTVVVIAAAVACRSFQVVGLDLEAAVPQVYLPDELVAAFPVHSVVFVAGHLSQQISYRPIVKLVAPAENSVDTV